MGKNIKHMSIKATTAQLYMRAAAVLFPVDPRRNIFGNVDPIFAKIWAEAKRWESMPNRREPLTVPMILTLIEFTQKNPDSRFTAIIDWFIVGLSAGLRLSEYGQPLSTLYAYDLENFEKSIASTAQAFLFQDIVFKGKHDKFINNSSVATLQLAGIESVTIKWRYQKNNQNGERIKFARNNKNPKLCTVRAMLRIRKRAQDLGIPEDTPIAVFR